MTVQFARGGVVPGIPAHAPSETVPVFLRSGCEIPGARAMAAPLSIAAVGRYVEDRGAIVAYEQGEEIDWSAPTYLKISSPSGICGPWERYLRPDEVRRIGEDALATLRETNDTSL